LDDRSAPGCRDNIESFTIVIHSSVLLDIICSRAGGRHRCCHDASWPVAGYSRVRLPV